MARTALIAGATGAASKRLLEVLLEDKAWSVIGLSRNPPPNARERLRYVAADLLDDIARNAFCLERQQAAQSSLLPAAVAGLT